MRPKNTQKSTDHQKMANYLPNYLAENNTIKALQVCKHNALQIFFF
jgi:hypothetical protein